MKLELNTSYPIRVEQEVAWGEQDSLGHVNNAVYFRYFENARVAQFLRLGLGHSQPDESGMGLILASITCNFLKPLLYPDKIRIEIGVSELSRSSFTQQYRIFSHSQQDFVARGSSVSVCYDYASGHSRPLPDKLRQALLELESTAAFEP